MEPFHLAHLIVLGMWLGVVITEVLFEFTASDAESLRAEARFHNNVDKYGELPILIAVLVTGTMLTVRAWPLTPLHVIKIAASLVAVVAALICVRWVFQRRYVGDVDAVAIPATNLDPGGHRRGLRNSGSLHRAGLFPAVAAHGPVTPPRQGRARK